MSKRMLLWLAAGACAGLYADVVTNRWVDQTLDNTPMTAVDFHAPENWEKGVFTSSDDYTYAFFENVSNTRSRYVNVSSPVRLSYIMNRNANVFIGTEISFASSNTDVRPGMGSDGNYPPYYYVDFVLKRFGKCPWFGAANFCGVVDVTQSNHDFIFSSGTQRFRADCFAPDSNPVREGLIAAGDTKVSNGSSSIVFVAPAGCDEHRITCSQTEGSPYLFVKEGADLAVGATVTGYGIPEGTYLKRVFPEGYVELSANAASSSDSNELTLAAFSPRFRQYLKSYYRQGDDAFYNVSVVKHREADVAVLEIDDFWVSTDKVKTSFGSESAEIPGLIHFRKVQRCGEIRLKNANILFDAAPGNAVPGFLRAVEFSVAEACTAAVSVPGEVEAVISNAVDVAGTLRKKDEGKLTLIFKSSASGKGCIAVDAGELAVTHKNAVGEGRGIALGEIAVASGATLHLDNVVLDVRAVDIGNGARITGSGTINVVASPDKSISFAGAAIDRSIKLKTTFAACEGALIEGDVSAQVPGHPAFWVDASKAASISYETVNGTNFVTRWNDWREGETMFCTNILNRAQFVNGDEMADKYVRIGKRNDITDLRQSERLVLQGRRRYDCIQCEFEVYVQVRKVRKVLYQWL